MNPKPPIEYSRTARSVELKDYVINGISDDWIEVTEWENGEGFDLHLSRGEQWLSLTWEEYRAMMAALGDWVEQPTDVCPHLKSTTDGTLTMAREQLMEDIDCIIEAFYFDNPPQRTRCDDRLQLPDIAREELTRILCDAVCKNFPIQD